ncbi:hypothetical protein BJ165DRAFT_436150 [Panaeolus papilionaceus]|nr:hypothetical protein BJ165DRAFT_436150 [Panaeolus papilionaceus]
MNQFREENHASMLSSRGITRIEDPEESPLSAEDILDLGYRLDEDTAPLVKVLLQSTANMVRPYKNWKNPHLDPQSLATDTGDPYEFPMTEFCPIFPRSQPKAQQQAKSKKNVTFILPTTHSELDLDMVDNIPSDPSLSRENLVIVDGWETIHSSPPSLLSTPEEEIDELDPIYLASTPEDPSHVERFNDELMIPVAIPRCREIGGTEGLTPHILGNKTISSFLVPLLSQPKVDEGEQEEARTGSPNSSMVGHASSRLTTRPSKGAFDLPDDLDEDIEELYGDQSSPHKIILNERLDGFKSSMMEVPDLPEPNVHPPDADFLVPTSFTQLLKSKNEEGLNFQNHAFLEKTKGQRSLALSLSWVSFTTTEKLPTIPQIVGVDELDLERIQPQVEHAFSLLKLQQNYTSSERVAFQDDPESSYTPPSLDDDFQLLLNRQERRRVAKRTNAVPMASSSDGGKDGGKEDTEVEASYASKRPRLDSDSPIPEPRQISQAWANQQLPPSSPPLLVPSDDSGIVLNDNVMMSDYKEHKLAYRPNDQEMPPVSSYLSYTTASPQPQQALRQAVSMDLADHDFMDFDAEVFEPLCMDSYPLLDAPAYDELPAAVNPSVGMKGGQTSQLNQAQDSDDSLAALENSRLAQNSLIGIFDFARLRGKRVSEPRPVQPAPETVPQPAVEHNLPSYRAPSELADKNTLLLPHPKPQPLSAHRYLGSLDVIQKHGLVLSLQSPDHLVSIAERESLQGADLVLDPYSTIIIFSLFTLPARSEAYLARVCAQSWKFKKLYIIFEAFPESWARVTNKRDETSEVSAYTPHILKAIRRFRRDVEVAAACGTRDAACVVKYAFADTVDEAAAYVRLCGDIAESEDVTEGQLWGEREWMLWKDRYHEEDDLAHAKGMNSFSAALLLCDDSFEALLNMSPEQRLERYAFYIGHDAVVC